MVSIAKIISWLVVIVVIVVLFFAYSHNPLNSLAKINMYRVQNDVGQIEFDMRVYKLAKARAIDMWLYGYLDHTNPRTGSCPDNMKRKYGLTEFEFVAENVWGGTDTNSPILFYPLALYGFLWFPINRIGMIDDWMSSTGHRYNLLYPYHTKGAVSCFMGTCVFLGLNYDGFGAGCYTKAEGLAFWRGA